MNEKQNQRLVEQIYAAFGRGDLTALINALSEDVIWSVPRGAEIPWGGRRRGHKEVSQFFQVIAEKLEVNGFKPREYFTRGDKVIALGWERIHVKSTGRTYEVEWAHEWKVSDGKVTEFREYADTATIIEALTK